MKRQKAEFFTIFIMSFPSLTTTYHRDTYPSISPTKQSLSQADKTVLITGGGVGLGFEIARSFAKASASRIIIVGRRSELLDDAVTKLREEFKVGTEFISHQGDIGDDSSVATLWEFLHSWNIFVHVLVLNAAALSPLVPDTLAMNKQELMDMFNVNLGGNFLMSAKFVQQPLRPTGQQLYLLNVSTGGIHQNPALSQNSYATSKAAFTALIGRVADEHPVDDVQIISFHPGILYSEGAAKLFDKSVFKWEEMALPADFSVWAASPEASWLHGRFVWASWDVDELKADFLKQIEKESGFLKVGVEGLKSASLEPYLNK
ncbi:hypothetical protein GYMLUDRAFT_265411 [Collybiopsis luxurians FD-317 M1]|uniref:Short-chain dehydrogenase/reductase n=1 Tax=Collybiopsis luxurians FD-317 M1 TaxID=944289 RepID=A0A0D0CCA8_9AGAR|nr:hypothetical protein GYMLUDRAFT_265411 [Collybiopsis luxurians FD-317 M1]